MIQMEARTEEKDIEIIEIFLTKVITFRKHLFEKMLLGSPRDFRIVALSRFERDALNAGIIEATGYARLEKKILPIRLFYRTKSRRLTLYLGHIKVSFGLEEIERIVEAEDQ